MADVQLVSKPATTQRGKETERLFARAQRGDVRALDALKERFADKPQVWESIGDVALHARDAWLKLHAGTNPVVAAGAERKIAAMRAELLGDLSTPLERLLVERIVVCWLQVAFVDHKAALFEERSATFKEGDYWQQAQERAGRRYLAAIRALAQMRRLLTPAVQVNIADKQINVAKMNGPLAD